MFVTFEGIEGVGKTTQLKFMAEKLSDTGISVLVTREPGGTPIGEEIRNILLAHRHERVVPMTELLLMFAARAQHLDAVIRPALEQNRWVLCDRFMDATYAYQGGGRGMPVDTIASLERIVVEDFKPDCTLIFDAPAIVGLKRVKTRNNIQDRFEKEKIDFFERVREVYQMRAKKDPKRYKIIDATKSLEQVQEIVLSITNNFIQERHNAA